MFDSNSLIWKGVSFCPMHRFIFPTEWDKMCHTEVLNIKHLLQMDSSYLLILTPEQYEIIWLCLPICINNKNEIITNLCRILPQKVVPRNTPLQEIAFRCIFLLLHISSAPYLAIRAVIK